MTVRDLGAEHGFDDPDDGWFGAVQPVEDAPSPLAPPPPRHDYSPPVEDDSAADTDRWFVGETNLVEPVEPDEPLPARVADRLAPGSVAATSNVVPTRRNGFVRASPPASYESRISNSGAWEFKSSSTKGPRLHPRAMMFAAAILIGVGAVVGVVLILRSPAGDQPAPVPPSESAAPPAPSSSAPAIAPVPSLPPPPPVPPPPAAEEITPPAVTRQYSPGYQTADTPKKPQQNVTRAPLSATPPPPPRQTDRGRATPGQSGSHGFFG